MKNRLLEIVGILSLSFIICSTMAVSSGIPDMMKDFPMQSRASLEFLMSAPTIAILIVIALTPYLTRYLKENTLIFMGLFLIGTAGILPFFFQSYSVILCSRIGLGTGIGFINPHAVTLIGEHFNGQLRQKLQGIRCSTETLGEATLIFVAGQLLVFGWQYAYLVYLSAFVVLFLYLCFVPKEMPKKNPVSTETLPAKRALKKNEIIIMAADAALGFLLVASLTSVAMRTSSFVVEAGFGDAVAASFILSLSIVSGFAGGILFGRLLSCMESVLLPVTLFAMGAGLSVIAFSNGLLMVGFGACLFGYFATIGLSYMFNSLSDCLPNDILTTANAVVLIGCNLGASTAPFHLQMFALINKDLSFGFLGYAFCAFVTAAALLLRKLKK